MDTAEAKAAQESAGEDSDRELGARRYDFRTAKKLSQSQRVRFGALHAKLAAALTKYCVDFQHLATEITFLGLEQMQGSNLSQCQAAGNILAAVALAPGRRLCYQVWERNLAFFQIERALGGTGEELFMEKELSALERKILLRQAQSIFNKFGAGFEKIAPPQGSAEWVSESQEYWSDVLPFDFFILARLKIKWNQCEGTLVLIYPYAEVKEWVGGNEEKAPLANEAGPDRTEHGVPETLGEVNVRVLARLAATKIKLADFLNLEVGDCLELQQSIHQPVDIYLNQKLKFRGFLGQQGRQVGIKISALAEHKAPHGHTA
jgi:flagellar motor switch protein FliM